jgi:tetratricopeptide repeat protein 21B
LIEANILAALINSEAGNHKAAENNLEEAFAVDFKIREDPLFLLMRSEVELRASEYEKALKTLEEAYEVPGVQDPNETPKRKLSLPFGQEERAKIFLNLVDAYAHQNQFDKARKVLAKAVGEFKGTPEEVRVMLAQSDLSLKQGDVKKALNMLKKITPDNPNFVSAKKKQAEIYLQELKDRQNYMRCYLEILDADQSVSNFKMVAKAMMNI